MGTNGKKWLCFSDNHCSVQQLLPHVWLIVIPPQIPMREMRTGPDEKAKIKQWSVGLSPQSKNQMDSSPVHSLGFIINALGKDLVPLMSAEGTKLPFRHRPPLCELISVPFSLPPTWSHVPGISDQDLFDSLQHMTLTHPLQTSLKWPLKKTTADFPSRHVLLGEESR